MNGTFVYLQIFVNYLQSIQSLLNRFPIIVDHLGIAKSVVFKISRTHSFKTAMQDLYLYLESFRHRDSDPLDEEGAHPASLVLELLDANDSNLRFGLV